LKSFLKVVGVIVLVFVLVVGGFALYMNNGMAATKDVTVNAINPAGLADGSYEGEYKAGRFTNKVKVTVKDGKVSSIEPEKTVTFEKADLTKSVFDSVIAKQNTDVDVQSGATLSTKAYLKAIDNALNNKK
jgi:uncharacterized protein with FMN-binding domain